MVRGGNEGERIGVLSAGGVGGEVSIRGGRGPIEAAIPVIVRVRDKAAACGTATAIQLWLRVFVAAAHSTDRDQL